MRTNKKTRETMPESWIRFFEDCRKLTKWGKYFPDGGNQCCAYSPEHDQRGVVQTAIRRTNWKSRAYLNESQKRCFDKIFGRTTYHVGIIYVCCTQHDGGVYVYDYIEMRKNGYLMDNQVISRGKNTYYEIPLEYCKKLIDLWDILGNNVNTRTIYQMARWQYEYLTKKNEYDMCEYDKIKKWEDLPDWCLWKYQNVDGSIIEGREKQFEEYKEKIKSHKRYIPYYKFDEEEQDNE